MQAYDSCHACLPALKLRIAGVFFLVLAASMWPGQLVAMSPEESPAMALRGKFAALTEQLQNSPLQEGLYLESSESPGALRGDIYAVVAYPFATVSETFTKPAHWCEALLLHLNIKLCQAGNRSEGTVLSIALGKKVDEALEDTHRVDFAFNVTAAQPDYMEMTLIAREGPLDTRNYHIALELLDLDEQRSFVHVRYSYDYGLSARLAMGAYLATIGSGKVGFTMVGGEKGGPPHPVGGLRGALERNTMRYYLAFDAYLGSLPVPPAQRFEASLERWFAATERYAAQLHEVEHDDYITMKRSEYLRQQESP